MAKRVLLQTVGMADTGFEALAKVVVDTRPDLVVHVASAESAARFSVRSGR